MANGQVMRDSATPEELAARKAEAKDPILELKQMEDKEAAKLPKPVKPPSLFDTTDFLCFNGLATLVPKRAVLHVPKGMQDRLRFTEGSAIRTWADFFPANIAWISNMEVSRTQAEGNAPLSEESLKVLDKSPMVIVATLQGSPISALPLKKPAAPATNPAAPATVSTTPTPPHP